MLSILGIFDIAITPIASLIWCKSVVICFQFWVSLTSLSLRTASLLLILSCDLLSILGIFDIAITNLTTKYFRNYVVICFQFWVSLTSLSLQVCYRFPPYQLWFAFNFGYLWHRYHSVQRQYLIWYVVICFQFWVSLTSLSLTQDIERHRLVVVICFQFWVSLTSLSLLTFLAVILSVLWFAFNFGYLWHRYHLVSFTLGSGQCCDLLSILGIFDIAITPLQPGAQPDAVVICFQFWVSLTSLSLTSWLVHLWRMLWFAFNFGYLWHRYHFKAPRHSVLRSCDLLSILGIFDIAITGKPDATRGPNVVICFQFWVSLTSLSLFTSWTIPQIRLWFAFNFGYLWHRYHSPSSTPTATCCCDLLSILGIFDIAITIPGQRGTIFHVVICFQFWVSLTSLSL